MHAFVTKRDSVNPYCQWACDSYIHKIEFAQHTFDLRYNQAALVIAHPKKEISAFPLMKVTSCKQLSPCSQL